MHASLFGTESLRKATELHDVLSMDRNDMHDDGMDDYFDYYMSECGDSYVIWGEDEIDYEPGANEVNDTEKENENEAAANSVCLTTEDNIAYAFFSLYPINFTQSILNSATLEIALQLFDLPNLLNDLDKDLELVQKQEDKSKEDHEEYFSQNVDYEFKRLSKKYHPDSIMKKGGTDEDVKKATEMQKVVNSVWSILKMLHRNFVESNYLSDQDFKYSTCSMVEIAILSNEERLRNLNNKILRELCWLSKIKHTKMIPNLNKFIKCSESCIQSFISDGESNFETMKNKAYSYFKLYLSGYNELFVAVKALLIICETDSDFTYIKYTVERMVIESSNDIFMLQHIKRLYSQQFVNIRSLCKQLFRDSHANAKTGFVLPFAEYSTLLFFCNEITKKMQVGNERKSKRWLGVIKQSMSNLANSTLCDGQYEFPAHACESYLFQRVNLRSATSLNKNIVKEKRKLTEKELENLSKEIQSEKGSSIHYRLLKSLSSYFCFRRKEEKIESNAILQQHFKLPFKIHWETCLEPIKVVVSSYAEYLKAKFLPLEVSSEYDIKDFKKHFEKLLEDFRSRMREEARKGQQEVREGQTRISNELNEMNENFKATIKKEADENAIKFRKIEATLKENEDQTKRIVENLEKETEERAKIEHAMKEEIEQRANLERLREELEKADQEKEDRLTKQLQEYEKTMQELLKRANASISLIKPND